MMMVLFFHFLQSSIFLKSYGKIIKTCVGWLVVFYVPSTARTFRDSTPIYCPLRKT